VVAGHSFGSGNDPPKMERALRSWLARLPRSTLRTSPMDVAQLQRLVRAPGPSSTWIALQLKRPAVIWERRILRNSICGRRSANVSRAPCAASCEKKRRNFHKREFSTCPHCSPRDPASVRREPSRRMEANRSSSACTAQSEGPMTASVRPMTALSKTQRCPNKFSRSNSIITTARRTQVKRSRSARPSLARITAGLVA
jgi:hypothetical protein